MPHRAFTQPDQHLHIKIYTKLQKLIIIRKPAYYKDKYPADVSLLTRPTGSLGTYEADEEQQGGLRAASEV